MSSVYNAYIEFIYLIVLYWPIHLTCMIKITFHFYRVMLRRARYCYGKWSVCLSVRPSVTLIVIT